MTPLDVVPSWLPSKPLWPGTPPSDDKPNDRKTTWDTDRNVTLNRCWFKAPSPPVQNFASRLPDHENKNRHLSLHTHLGCCETLGPSWRYATAQFTDFDHGKTIGYFERGEFLHRQAVQELGDLVRGSALHPCGPAVIVERLGKQCRKFQGET